MANAVKVTADNFKQEVLESAVPVLADFWAEWCVPCKMVGPVLEKLAGDYQGKIKVAKIDVDEQGDLAAQFNIVSIPTLILFHQGKPVRQQVGAVPRPVLEKMIGEYV